MTLRRASIFVLAASTGFAPSCRKQNRSGGPVAANVAPPQSDATPRVYNLLFMVLTAQDVSEAGPLDALYYERVLRRTAIALERESLNGIQLNYSILQVSSATFGDEHPKYSPRNYQDWYKALTAAAAPRTYDILAFGPDRNVEWCRDAHSMGFEMDGVAFACLEPSPRPALASNLLIHKIFHTFGFFHQQLRNKEYRLLDWELGLPSYRFPVDLYPSAEASHSELDDISFFTPMALTALGIGSAAAAAPGCDVASQPHCAAGDWPHECRDVIGPACRDADNDGIVDINDGYPASPPVSGVDSDSDGIPDALDLCPGTKVEISSDGLTGGPMNYWTDSASLDLRLSVPAETPDAVYWEPVAFATGKDFPLKEFGEVMFFDGSNSHRVTDGVVHLDARDLFDIPIQINIAYQYRHRSVRRSLYIYTRKGKTSPTPWGYFNEKEWLYFGRFGCDTPVNVDVFDVNTYDENVDGLPDAKVANFDVSILKTYDWDNDGVPDEVDTLPTVAGSCTDGYVRGVRDSDGDGLCDPGYLRYTQLPPSVPRSTYFGEIPTEMGNDPDFDRCPYLRGPRQTAGCPPRADGRPWYDDSFLFSRQK
jgi:hypothetical protein